MNDLNFLVVIVLSIVDLSHVFILISILLIIMVIDHCVVRCVKRRWSVRI